MRSTCVARSVAILRGLFRIACLSPLLLAVACSPLRALGGFAGESDVARVSSVRYGGESRQMLDVYEPRRPHDGTVVVFFYGGGWRMGQRADYRFLAQTLARSGATVVVADYRLYPQGVFPDFMHDAAAAVAWTARNIAGYGGNPARIYLLGHSAGAHIVTLLALDPRYLAAQGLEPSLLAGVDALSAPTDFAATLEARYRPVFVDQATLERAQPLRYARGDAPPMLLQHGADDSLVNPRNSRALAAAITARGGTGRAIVYPGVGHAGTVLAFSAWLGESTVLDNALAFMQLRPRR